MASAQEQKLDPNKSLKPYRPLIRLVTCSCHQAFVQESAEAKAAPFGFINFVVLLVVWTGLEVLDGSGGSW